jgi:tRNA-2-methylthio-N6-dimethylallyladenosine synthase
VPYTRGRERSRRPDDILQEIQELAANGTKEVMLLGQNVNSYGKNLETPIDFADLLRMVNDIEGLERIRFMTSHPKDITQKLLETMAEGDKICEYLHLPIQAGSDRILYKMNRKYTKNQYLDIVNRARQLMPDLGVSTDIILGFPGEDDSDFMETIDVIKQVGYDSAFTYLYSKRTGTPAATHEGQVTEEKKHERMDYLLGVLNPMIEERMLTFKDREVEVLVEGFSKTSKSVLFGRTRQNHSVTFEGDPSYIGKVVTVKITKPKRFSLFGEII